MENIATTPITFRAEKLEAVGRFAFRMEPSTGTIGPHSTATLNAALTLFCTTRFETLVPLIVESSAEDITATPPLVIRVLSKPSIKLDPEELKLQRPPVGSGTSGTVFRAVWRGQDVSVKQLFQQIEEREFAKEMVLLDKLRSPFLVTFIGAVHVPGNHSIVTEYLPLGSLLTATEKKPFSQALRYKCALDCARGLLFLHSSGVSHRAVKPENLLVVSTRLDDPVACKLVDFKNPTAPLQEAVDAVAPRPVYVAPEVLEKDAYSSAGDVYSFAMVLLFLQLGAVPYQSVEFPTPADIVQFVKAGKRLPIPPECPPACADLIQRCWAQSPAERPGFLEITGILNPVYEAEKGQAPTSRGDDSSDSDSDSDSDEIYDSD
jgi:serine/threonine protein kinase